MFKAVVIYLVSISACLITTYFTNRRIDEYINYGKIFELTDLLVAVIPVINVLALLINLFVLVAGDESLRLAAEETKEKFGLDKDE